MEDLHDVLCSRCGGRCSETVITDTEGKEHRVPVFARIAIGIIEGEQVDLVDAPMTSLSRSALCTPLSRFALCERCLAEVFELPLNTAAADPMMHEGDLEGVDGLYRALQATVWVNPEVPRVEKMRQMHARTLHAVRVARGAAVSELPEHQRPIPPDVRRKAAIDEQLRDVPAADREEVLSRLRETGVSEPPLPKPAPKRKR
jgi:hypothetical protein